MVSAIKNVLIALAVAIATRFLTSAVVLALEKGEVWRLDGEVAFPMKALQRGFSLPACLLDDATHHQGKLVLDG